jgi:hypothetical protein
MAYSSGRKEAVFGLEPRDGLIGRSTRYPKRRKVKTDISPETDVSLKSPFMGRSNFRGNFRWLRR